MKNLSSTKPIWCSFVNWCIKCLIRVHIWNLKHSLFLYIRLLLIYLMDLLSMYRVELLFEVTPHIKVHLLERIRWKRVVRTIWTHSLIQLWIIFQNVIFGSNWLSMWCVRVFSLFWRYYLVFDCIIEFCCKILWHCYLCWSPTATISSWSCTSSSIVFSLGNIKWKRILWLLWVLGVFIFFFKMSVLSFIGALGYL